jgi:hypothetical protein
VRAVNLLPRDQATSRRSLPSGRVLAAVVAPVLLLVLVGGAVVMQRQSVASKRERLSALEQELATLPAPVPVDPANVALAQEKGSRITALADVLDERVAFDRILRELSLVLPEDVWLTSLVARSPFSVPLDGSQPPAAAPAPPPADAASAPATGTPPAAPAPSAPAEPAVPVSTDTAGFVLTGYTYSQEGVARLLARLAVIPHLNNVQLEKSALVPIAGRSVVEFTILAELRIQGPSA